jgi:hypothetical protein
MSAADRGQLFPDTQSHLSVKRPHEDIDPESDPENDDNDESSMEQMDFEHEENVTATQAIGEDNGNLVQGIPELPLPLSAEHAALRSDFETITRVAMENLYNRITADITKSAADTSIAFQKTTDQLRNQISSLGTRVTQLQQQILAYQRPVQPPVTVPAAPPAKKILRRTLTKNSATGESTARNAAATDVATPGVPLAIPPAPPTNTRRWETVSTVAQKRKTPTPKLIPTKYPQAEREVTCHFPNGKTNDTINIQLDKTYAERQAIADTALRHVNAALVDNKDVLVPPFIRARVTVRGSVILTTSNAQHNVIYEDYSAIIAEALSYYGKCEKVEIGKRYSQFLLHGVPTHLSLPEISDSIATNYPQLVQGQTPRWLTPTDRREYKSNSTVVMTLTGNVKKADIGRRNLIVCNRECQLDDYIPYGRSTQCRNCQAYGHPAALCRSNSCCAVCAGPHETKEHPCTLPICKKGPACTHPPIRCANCDAPHKASDPNCPERIKLRNFTKTTTNTTNQGDAPMAEVAE